MSIKPEHRPLVVLLVLAVLLVGTWNQLSGLVHEPETVSRTDAGWTARFNDSGATTDYVVSFVIERASGSTTEGSDWYSTGFRELDCTDSGSVTTCRGLAQVDVGETTIGASTISGAATATIDNIEPVREVRRAPFDGRWISRGFLGLLILLPLVWALHRRVEAGQWVLVGLSVVTLLALQFTFTVSLVALLLAFYAIGVRYRESDTKSGRRILGWICVSLIALLFFKNFKALLFLPFDRWGALSLVLPLGTSYFLIRIIDLQLRWHRGKLEDLSLRHYLLYLFFPGTLVAGPIEMIDTFLDGRADKISVEDISSGFMRIAIGLAKKLVVVDLVLRGLLLDGGVWDAVVLNPSDAGLKVIAFCILSYLLAYLDFSAYSDIAIGTSRLLGYTIGENFAWPVLAGDLAEFWRRWHISLSGWCFRNAFFPVMMATRSRTIALLITLLVVGMWHDLTLSWLTWGLYHGAGLAALAAWRSRDLLKRIPGNRILRTIATNLFVAGGFAFVSIRDYSLAWTIFIEFWFTPLDLV